MIILMGMVVTICFTYKLKIIPTDHSVPAFSGNNLCDFGDYSLPKVRRNDNYHRVHGQQNW